ncbi:hypothetical protein H072_278 [Dactylellina haptotyla CBS 200.50]|uniref:Uncharacterized protein n=1 Tax=Dactylellina haptotyla (strain CBS 200.50) TaxID=1284197 RepID=S8AXM8_DACHA|nr:hypothetical protein H072_278 [Dactylellina haptotyla CBS 200.50]
MEYELRPYGTSASQPTSQQPSPPEKSADVGGVYREQSNSDSEISPHGYTHVSETASIREHNNVRTGWMPLVLRPWALFLFLLVYIGIFITLIGLYVSSRRKQGLSTESESRHYLWTYGPTAVFIILAAFWRHLDYQLKLLMPWVELASGPKAAKLSVLLDYISPFQPVAFWIACKNRHWMVISSAVAFAALKLAIIFATGLFILQPTALETNDGIVFEYANAFSAAGFNLDFVDSRASFTVFGTSALNLSYPAGTNRQYAIQSLTNPSNISLSNVAAISLAADVFNAKLDCQTASLNWTNDRDTRTEITPLSQFYNTTAFSPGCTLKLIRLDAPSWLGNDTQQGYYARIQNSTCAEIQDPVAGSRLFIAMTYSTRANYTNTLQNYTAFVCKPSYTVQHNRITVPNGRLNDYSQISEMQALGSPTTIPGFTAKDLTDGIVYSLAQSTQQIAFNGWDRTFDSFFQLMQASRPDLNYTAFSDPEILQTTAGAVYSSLAAQIASISLLKPPATAANRTVDATIKTYQQRLVLRPVSIIVMEVIVAVLILITIYLSVVVPRHGVAPRDPSSIGAIATILSRSRGLEQSLAGTSNLTEKELDAWLNRYRFYSTIEMGSNRRIFKVELEDRFPNSGRKQRYSEEVEKQHIPDIEKHKWWRPLGLRWWVIIPLVIFPIAIIVVLEVLYQKSKRENGLAYIPIEGYVHYTWVYIPAFVMVVIVTLFNMLDYTARCIAPYQAMRADSTVASRGILYNPSGKLTLPALWFAIKEKHVTVIATTFAVLIAPVLTIAVSGLYFSQLFSRTSSLTVQQTTWFNTTTPEYSVNTTDDISSGLIVSGNLSYPTWTYEDLALSQLSLPNNTNFEAADAVTVTAPALRANLNCTIVPQDQYVELRLGQDPPPRGANLTEVSAWVNITMPGKCGNSGFIYSDATFLTLTFAHPVTGHFGTLLAMGFDVGCPQFAVFYGRMDNNRIANFSTLLCSGWVQSLDVTSSFLLPSFKLDPSAPAPMRLEDTAQWFSNVSIYPGYTFATTVVDPNAPDLLDDFLNAVVYGKDGIPLDELDDPQKLLGGVKRLYGITTTQTIAQDGRIDFDKSDLAVAGDDTSGMITGTSRTTARARLVQSEASTRVLQVILAFIMLTTVVAYIFVKARELLPRESNSIATIGGYLAGSDVLRLVPDGAEWGSGGKGGGTKGEEVFAGYMFGFGWWADGEREGRKRYGVGIGRGGGRPTSPN